MKKHESVKNIDLKDRQSLMKKGQVKQPKYGQSRLQSVSRSSQKSISKDTNQYFECFTDRTRNTKIHQFNTLQTTQAQSYLFNNALRTNIKTYIRFKPFTKQDIMNENSESMNNGVDIIDEKKIIIDKNYCYTFDKIFQPQATQRTIYEQTSKEMIKSFTNGYNGTIFAYGQTGSGKTYTMFGGDEYSLGIIPQIIDDLFYQIQIQKCSGVRKITLSCSMFQIYKQTIGDLMNEKQKDIKIKQSSNGSVQMQNLTIRQVTSKQQLIGWINQGSELRKTRGTEINERSSRSHLIFTLYLAIKLNDFQSKLSKLNLVDLAGSEKVSKTKVFGEGLQQAIKINLSLSCLGNTIYALSRGQEHVPFRDSKLTRVLQQSLSGNSITRVIVTCSMLASCKQQTISSLKFANRIKKIKTLGTQNLKKLNEQGVNKFMYQTLKVSFQNCQQKLLKIKTLIESIDLKTSKQQLIQSIKLILRSEQRNLSDNQFMSPFSLFTQTFRSPTKQENYQTECYNILSQTNQRSNEKDNSRTIDLNIQIKNLQSIIIQQQASIQSQIAQIQILKRKGKSLNKEQILKIKGTHKLKILKANPKNPKIKQALQSKQKYGKQNNLKCMQRQAVLQKMNKNYEIDEQNNLGTYRHKQITNEYIKQKGSFQKMQNQILMKQIMLMGVQVTELRKFVLQNGGYKKVQQIQDKSNKLINQKVLQQQNLLKTQLTQKDSYITQLQNIIAQKIGFSRCDNEQRYSNLNQEIDVSKLFTKNLNNCKSISLFTSPTSSFGASRVNSAKYLHKI